MWGFGMDVGTVMEQNVADLDRTWHVDMSRKDLESEELMKRVIAS